MSDLDLFITAIYRSARILSHAMSFHATPTDLDQFRVSSAPFERLRFRWRQQINTTTNSEETTSRFADSRLMADRSRINSSTAAVMASGGSVQSRPEPGKKHHIARRLASQSSARAQSFLRCRHCLPTQIRKQPDGGLLDKLVFGVGVAAHWS